MLIQNEFDFMSHQKIENGNHYVLDLYPEKSDFESVTIWHVQNTDIIILNWIGKNPLDIAPIKIKSFFKKIFHRLKFNAANFGQKSYHEFSSTSFNFSLHILDFKIQFQNLKSKKWPPFIYQSNIIQALSITVIRFTKGFLNWKMN